MTLLNKIKDKSAKIGIIGLGYVGLPLVIAFCEKGFDVIGFDSDESKIVKLNRKESYIKHIPHKHIESIKDKFQPVNDYSKMTEADTLIMCIPTPLDKYRDPDLSYVEDTTREISKYLRKEQIVILESTTYPGTTEEIIKKILEDKTNLKAGKDFYMAYSPEREDPNNQQFNTTTIPKVVGADDEDSLNIAVELYKSIIGQVVPVSSNKVAEATKILENTYRAVNIAMVNELKMLFDKMGIDIWEVIEAAKTKPFGFQAFYPGPGLGGHCIPIDPFYLTWKAREYEFSTRFIELAGEINTGMPYYVLKKVIEALNNHRKSISGSKLLILGLAYKKDVDDTRESPSFKVIKLLQENGAIVDYNDPHIPKTYKTREYDYDMKSVDLTKENLKKYDCIIIVTDHSEYDGDFIADNSNLIVDTRNLIKNYKAYGDKIIRA
jgi:UDP-N-acetyl-D-glucosamine dehydrogenase